MISLTIGTTFERKTVVVSEDTTPRQVISDNNIAGTNFQLDSRPLLEEEMNMTFEELQEIGKISGDKARLVAVSKPFNG